nr:uncharacterized protein LOC112794740 [Arachis hypogaea]
MINHEMEIFSVRVVTKRLGVSIVILQQISTLIPSKSSISGASQLWFSRTEPPLHPFPDLLRHTPSNGSSPSRSLPSLLLLRRRLYCHCSIVPLSFHLLPPLPPPLASHEPPPCCCLGFYHMLVSRNRCLNINGK